jgi:hypothetical protein
MKTTDAILFYIGNHPQGACSGEVMTFVKENTSSFGKSARSILGRLVREGRIIKKGTLYYPPDSFKPPFVPFLDDSLKELYSSVKGAMPFANICIWHTDSLVPLMHDVPNFRMTLFGVESASVPFLADSLENMTDSLVLRESDNDIILRLASRRNLVVVGPMVSQAPTMDIVGVTVPSLEKILVDILCDNALRAMTGSQAYEIYSAAFDRFNVEKKKLLRYAGRRNRKQEVEKILKEIGS